MLNQSTTCEHGAVGRVRTNMGKPISFPMTLVSDSGPAFRNRFEEKCAKLGVHVEENSAYNPSTYSGLKARWAV